MQQNAANSRMPIVFHRTFRAVLETIKDGDVVYVLPGVYHCDALPWIECDVQIVGLGSKREDIVLLASDTIGDMFLNTNANALLIENVTLKTSAETNCIVLVHAGSTTLSNCVLDGGSSARNSIVALSKAEVALDDCVVIHSGRLSGIQQRPGSNVTMNGQRIDELDLSEEDNTLNRS